MVENVSSLKYPHFTFYKFTDGYLQMKKPQEIVYIYNSLGTLYRQYRIGPGASEGENDDEFVAQTVCSTYSTLY